MKQYEEFLLKEFNDIKAEYPALVNTAKLFEEGFNVIVEAMRRRTKADKAVITKWLTENI